LRGWCDRVGGATMWWFGNRRFLEQTLGTGGTHTSSATARPSQTSKLALLAERQGHARPAAARMIAYIHHVCRRPPPRNS
jgi:hypothetical protein